MKSRLDEAMVKRGLISSRSQAENYIKLGKVTVDGRVVTKAGSQVSESNKLKINETQYVSRAALKLASVAQKLGLTFDDKTVLDVGSSTGGFSDFALKNSAKKIVAVDVGSQQLHGSLRLDPRLELHEKTDIREFNMTTSPDIILIDVSFISLREIMPKISDLASDQTQIVAMLKPQFESGRAGINKGVVKNDTVRRKILKDFETWIKNKFIVISKADSEVAGQKGNIERFYLLKKTGKLS